ncbi:hypothetical protein GE107_17360 [Cohnella sp. CFH 77786]|uniref:hypothetical protein n=1 Tax=Cohnella sp. CFH 77786 TaxID=2662265 RepID=UPI001C60F576|nr:hypothetical protein [Cohnella sp. CFH 77786]MBW5447825.1 hypothetical protein [Cohnella sp. CFH 77786]
MTTTKKIPAVQGSLAFCRIGSGPPAAADQCDYDNGNRVLRCMVQFGRPPRTMKAAPTSYQAATMKKGPKGREA